MKIFLSLILISLSIPLLYLGIENIPNNKDLNANYSGDSYKVSGKFTNYYFKVDDFEFIYDGVSDKIIVKEKITSNIIELSTFGSKGNDVVKIFDEWGGVETPEGTKFIPKTKCKYFEISLFRNNSSRNINDSLRSYNFCLETIDDSNLTNLY